MFVIFDGWMDGAGLPPNNEKTTIPFRYYEMTSFKDKWKEKKTSYKEKKIRKKKKKKK